MSQEELPAEAGAVEAHRMAEEMEYGARTQGPARWLIPVLAALWSLFQLSLPYFVILNDVTIRAVHLVFAIALVYLSFPAIKKLPLPKPLRFLGEKSRIPWPDYVLAAVAALAAAYFLLDYEGIAARTGRPLPRDIIAGAALLVFLLEAARRALGPALPIVATLFLLYATFAEHMPMLLAFKAVPLDRLVGQLTLSTEGVYGVPLYVSASMVYLFVLLGAMLDRTGGGEYFVKLSISALGRFRGGPAKAAVLASGFTGMVSGSSIANVVTTGTFTIPMMKRSGYPAQKAAAIEVASSVNGQLMPPIMGAAAFIMAEYCNVPYIEVVRAAAIPALLAYVGLLYITHLEACKLGLKGVPREDLPPFWATFRSGIHFLVPLGLLVYLLTVLRLSPEISAFWAIGALAAMVLLHNLWSGLRAGDGAQAALKKTAVELWESLVSGGKNMMGIGVAVAAAGIIVGVVSLGPGQAITEIVYSVAGDNIYAILFMTAVASLLLGMGLPTTANYIVMASLTASVITSLAEKAGFPAPIIAAHLFVFYFGILADDTPPVGLAAYAGAAIAKTDPIRTGIQAFTYDMRTAILPFMFFFNTDLLLIDIHSPLMIAAVAGCGVVGMLAFAALLQGYTLAPNRMHEGLLLLAAALFLLQPLILVRIFEVLQTAPFENKWVWRAAGVACYAAALGLQWPRREKAVAA
ncbi:MAG: TRAP transporter fused permease subunit [Candidatus Hydrogenedens sp.]|nr:TRAP transporter fused permease subunit [Candidatus Hydrogenedens sp.]